MADEPSVLIQRVARATISARAIADVDALHGLGLEPSLLAIFCIGLRLATDNPDDGRALLARALGNFDPGVRDTIDRHIAYIRDGASGNERFDAYMIEAAQRAADGLRKGSGND